MWLPIAVFCLAVSGLSFGSAQKQEVKTYYGYKTYNLTLNTEAKFNFVDKYYELEGYDVLNRVRLFGQAHVLVEPKLQTDFENELKKNGIRYQILHDNVGKLLKKNEPKLELRATFGENSPYSYDHFPRYNEIVRFMRNLVQNRTYSRLIVIGNSSEGRPIYGVEVARNPRKPVFLIDAGIHAREWASHVSAMYIMQQVVENEKEFANTLSIVIIPCVNPDGYEYSHTSDRLWRKSRSRQGNGTCFGVDLNRNFDSHWGEFRAETSDVCDRLYAGPKPFSEPESVALGNAILRYKPVAYLTIHSFGSYLLYPWGFTKNLPVNSQTLHRIAYNVAQRMKQINGSEYTIGSSATVLYEGSGASDDWSMEKANVSLVWTMELPAYSDEPFFVPDNVIPNMVVETFEAFLVMFNQIYSYTLESNNLS